jgi:hypothetical protein
VGGWVLGLDNWRRNKIGRRLTRSNCRLFHSLLSKRCVCAGVREMFENLLVAVALHGGWLGVYTIQHQDISSLSYSTSQSLSVLSSSFLLLFLVFFFFFYFFFAPLYGERERRWGRESPTPAAYLSFPPSSSSLATFFSPPSLSLYPIESLLIALFASSRRATGSTVWLCNDYGDHLPLIFIRAPGPELNARVCR